MTEGDEARGTSDGRDESEAERADRNLAELLQELRVAALGVQVLFGFLFGDAVRGTFHGLELGPAPPLHDEPAPAAAVATALLTGPVAYHRLVFRRHTKTQLVTASNAMALGGLAAVGLAVASAVWLVLQRVVDHGSARSAVRSPERHPRLLQPVVRGPGGRGCGVFSTPSPPR